MTPFGTSPVAPLEEREISDRIQCGFYKGANPTAHKRFLDAEKPSLDYDDDDVKFGELSGRDKRCKTLVREKMNTCWWICSDVSIPISIFVHGESLTLANLGTGNERGPKGPDLLLHGRHVGDLQRKQRVEVLVSALIRSVVGTRQYRTDVKTVPRCF